MEAIVTTANAQRWQAALKRAIAEAVDILVEPISGEVFCESSTRPGTLYAVSRTSCTCKAGQQGVPCKHRACFLAQLGELSLEPDPGPGITLEGTSDRQEIRVGGRYFGFAAFDDASGWTVFRGKFPHARKLGTYCTLEEIERDLAARFPAPLPFPAATSTADLATVAA
jgi:hypothetical protein